MSIRLYNTLSGKIEEFKPIKPNEVSMYVCGPTVYNHAHIGNARPIIVFDTLRRLFEAQGYTVKYVSNYTDVDDKIIKKAHEENVAEGVVSARYIEAYQKVRDSLNTEPLLSLIHISEPTRQAEISYAVFCLKKKKKEHTRQAEISYTVF